MYSVPASPHPPDVPRRFRPAQVPRLEAGHLFCGSIQAIFGRTQMPHPGPYPDLLLAGGYVAPEWLLT